jgi:rubrerythrin
MLGKAIEGETYEFTTMYPQFYENAVSEKMLRLHKSSLNKFLNQKNMLIHSNNIWMS